MKKNACSLFAAFIITLFGCSDRAAWTRSPDTGISDVTHIVPVDRATDTGSVTFDASIMDIVDVPPEEEDAPAVTPRDAPLPPPADCGPKPEEYAVRILPLGQMEPRAGASLTRLEVRGTRSPIVTFNARTFAERSGGSWTEYGVPTRHSFPETMPGVVDYLRCMQANYPAFVPTFPISVELPDPDVDSGTSQIAFQGQFETLDGTSLWIGEGTLWDPSLHHCNNVDPVMMCNMRACRATTHRFPLGETENEVCGLIIHPL